MKVKKYTEDINEKFFFCKNRVFYNKSYLQKFQIMAHNTTAMTTFNDLKYLFDKKYLEYMSYNNVSTDKILKIERKKMEKCFRNLPSKILKMF